MGDLTIYFVLAGMLALALIGLMLYARFAARPAAVPANTIGVASETNRDAPESAGRSRPLSGQASVSASEGLVDVVDWLEGRYFLTTNGCLIALYRIEPILATADTSPELLGPNFVAVVQALKHRTTIQIVQLPLPPRLGDLTDRYARLSHAWWQAGEQFRSAGDAELADTVTARSQIAAQLGAQILATGSQAARRESFVVLSRSLGLSGKPTPEKLRIAFQTLDQDGKELQAVFQSKNIPITLLTGGQTLDVLWNAYNPEQSAWAQAAQEGERFAAIMGTGEAQPPAAALSPEQVRRALENPRAELRRLLAPPVVEERPAGVRFRDKELLVYYANDFQAALPPIRRMLSSDGRFAHRLYVSYFITSPAPDEMARLTRKASTAKQALQAVAAKAGSLPSYKHGDELDAIETARWGAETEKNVSKYLGLYLGLLVSDESADADRLAFESTLRSNGVDLVPAQWLALDAWRTLLPLGQRFHHYEDRNLFPENLAPLNPVTAEAWFDPGGEFCGFVASGESAGLPVAIRREREAELLPSDAVVGAPGSGKSYSLKLRVCDWIAQGQRVFIVDPKLEFDPLTRKLGGQAFSLQGGRGFNLLHFEPFSIPSGLELGVSLTNHVFAENLYAIEALYTLAKAQGGRATGVEKNLLTTALKRAMVLKGMDPKDPQTWEANRIFLYDVYEVLTREMFDQDPETIRLMQAVLEQYAAKDGQYFDQYNTPNTFSLDADLITATLGLAQLSADPAPRAITGHFALRLAANHAVRSFLNSSQPTPFHIVIDEASQLLTTPALVSSVVAMLSLLSAYGISVHLAFQDMEAITRADDMVSSEGAQSANTLSAVLPAYWLFNQGADSAAAAVRLLSLPPELKFRIEQNPKGHCLLAFAGRSLAIPIEIIAPEAVRPLLATDPESMHRMLRSAGMQAERGAV